MIGNNLRNHILDKGLSRDICGVIQKYLGPDDSIIMLNKMFLIRELKDIQEYCEEHFNYYDKDCEYHRVLYQCSGYFYKKQYGAHNCHIASPGYYNDISRVTFYNYKSFNFCHECFHKSKEKKNGDIKLRYGCDGKFENELKKHNKSFSFSTRPKRKNFKKVSFIKYHWSKIFFNILMGSKNRYLSNRWEQLCYPRLYVNFE